MTDISMPRLSPDNIADLLIRSCLYREIQTDSDDWPSYEVQPDEVLRPELIAHRHYGTAALKWVVLIAARLDDIGNHWSPVLLCTCPRPSGSGREYVITSSRKP